MKFFSNRSEVCFTLNYGKNVTYLENNFPYFCYITVSRHYASLLEDADLYLSLSTSQL